jgi:glycosyltransferase involved in cell wall biosynthesis
VAQDLSTATGIPRERISTIYNPVVPPELLTRAKAPLEHPWFEPDSPPVLLGVGRLSAQKDFPTLLRAFARVRRLRPARLIILGEGKRPGYRPELLALARELGVGEDVQLPGFAENPYAYMARASVFVMSSAWEGLPSVLVEALACGCPVVSTDCPSGPREILQGGRYGRLVPVGDAEALAKAILATLDAPPDGEMLRTRGAEFSVGASTQRYLDVLS